MKRVIVVCVVAVACGISQAEGAILTIPDTTLDAVTNIFTPETFTVSGDFLPTDTLWVSAIGEMSASGVEGADLASGFFTVNAAGVIVTPETTHTGHHPGEFFVDAPSGFRFGAVKIGNSSLGYYHLFPADTSTGLGSPTPPTAISSNAMLKDIFTDPGFTGIADGTVLELSIHDINTLDNSGGFNLSTIPEPTALIVWSLLGTVAITVGWRRRRTHA